MMISYEDGNETTGSLKRREFFYQKKDCYLLKDSGPNDWIWNNFSRYLP
jgi:hypothetical protein